MANYNRVLLIGNLTRDPELRYTPSGTAVAEFGLAVNRTWSGRDGQKQEDTCFVDITAWAKQAELINEYCRKGRPLFIEGRLQYDTWEGKDGQRRSKLRVVVENFQFLGSRSGGAPGDDAGAPSRRRSQDREGADRRRSEPPNRRTAPSQAPPRSAADDEPPEDAGYTVADDDIPF